MRRCFQRNLIRNSVWMCFILLVGVGCSSSSSGDLTPFSQDGNSYNGSAWSPDGRWLAAPIFNSKTIQLFSSNGQAISRLHTECDLLGLDEDFAWLPNGQISCFIRNDPTKRLLTIVELDQSGQTKKTRHIIVPLTAGAYIYASQWNPRHFWLATIADKIAGENSLTLYLTDLQGHFLIPPMQINARRLAWSPDGTTLALTEAQGDIVLLTIQPTTSGKLTVNQSRRLVAGASDLGNVAWSPSGHWVVCRHASYKSEDYLFLLATDGSGKQIKLTSSTTDGQLDFPAWSPDGKQLIVARIAVSGNVLMSLDIATLLKEKGVEP